MVGPEELRPEQRVAFMESIFQKIERLVGSEFASDPHDDEHLAHFRIKNLPGIATLFVSPCLEEGMNASVRLSFQGREGEVVISQIPGASIHEEDDKVTFSKRGENGAGSSLSIKEGGVIVTSLGSTNSQD